MMLSNDTAQNLNRSLLQKITLERCSSTDDIHPLSLIMMDVSSFSTILSEIDNKKSKISSTITKILEDNTRKSDIKTCIHKSKFALFLPNTLESGAHTLSHRLCEKIKEHLNMKSSNYQKCNYILFQISTYIKTSQGNGELEVFNKQYKKTLNLNYLLTDKNSASRSFAISINF